jgi:hypothetical protein
MREPSATKARQEPLHAFAISQDGNPCERAEDFGDDPPADDHFTDGCPRKKPCKIAKSGEPKRKVCPYLLAKSSAGEVNVLYYQ